ncbi:MAG: hypothetical protein AAF423_13640 [Pseudomonadota bacterium]
MLFAAFAAFPEKGRAFDAGYHFDLTRVVLKREGLGPDAINSAILANWLTDYYSTAPVAKNLFLKPALNRMHFDNLGDRKQVELYHYRFLSNLRVLIKEAAVENDRIKTLILIGVAHHVIQDFYSHSNWVELFPRRPNGGFEVQLFPGSPQGLQERLRTGVWPGGSKYSHGSYDRGLNKDSHVRPHWENAFVMAHVATRDVTRQIRYWLEEASPGFWNHVASLNLTARNRRELLRDLASAHDISMWVKAKLFGLPASDGHWKGNLSGDASRFASANNAFNTWKNSFLTRHFREENIAVRLALGLDKPAENGGVSELAVPASGDFRGYAILVRIHQFRLPEAAGNFSLVAAKTTINGESYLGRIFSRQNIYNRAGIPAWHEIHIDAEAREMSQVEISLTAYNSGGSTDEKELDINPEQDAETLAVSFPTKEIQSEAEDGAVVGYNSGIRKSIGNGPNSAEIIYSIEFHAVD